VKKTLQGSDVVTTNYGSRISRYFRKSVKYQKYPMFSIFSICIRYLFF